METPLTREEERTLDMIDNYFCIGCQVRPHINSFQVLRTTSTAVLVINTLEEKSMRYMTQLTLSEREKLPVLLKKRVNEIAPYNHSNMKVSEKCFLHQSMPEDYPTTCKQCEGRKQLNRQFKVLCNLCMEDPIDDCLICAQLV
jgi:hypothetical protein